MTAIPERLFVADDEHVDRDRFLAACAHVWDHGRSASRATMLIGSDMILKKLGGTLLLHAESIVAKRTVPEASYVSEGMLPRLLH